MLNIGCRMSSKKNVKIYIRSKTHVEKSKNMLEKYIYKKVKICLKNRYKKVKKMFSF